MRQGTRAAVLTICLGVSVVLLLIERQKTSQVSDELADLDRRTASISSDLQQQISDARTKAEGLDAALSQAREQLSLNNDQHRTDAAAASDVAAKLQTERQRTAALADRLSDTERRSAAQAAELQQRLEAEQTKAAGLDRDLGEARRQLAKTDQLQRSAAASTREAEESLDASRHQAAGLADRLAETERRAVAETRQFQERLEAEHAKASSLEVDLAAARLKLTEAAKSAADLPPRDDRSPQPASVSEADRRPAETSRPAPAALPTGEPPAQVTVPGPELALSTPPVPDVTSASPRVPPDDVPARIVLRYAVGSESARARAQFAELLLQEQGLRIEDHASPAKGLSVSRVSFYYKEDQRIAKTIADALARITGSDTVQKLPTSPKSLPRPGTIEVTIAG